MSLFSGRPLIAVIDGAAFRHNIALAERYCAPARVMVVLKADGYGHGLVPMAGMAGNRDLAVATREEAEELIAAGIQQRIWVLEGPFSEACLSACSSEKVVWIIHAEWQAALLHDFVKHQTQTGHSPLQVWLKLDSGMHRLGLNAAALDQVMAILRGLPEVHIEGTLTHFAFSDRPDQAGVAEQLACDSALRDSQSLQDLSRSCANSGAVLYYPETHFQWVRPGIMLYGGMPDPRDRAADVGLQPVMSLQSAVIAIRKVPAGDTVGYGGFWQAQRDSLIATVAGGYGDGYPRHAPNGTPVSVNGQIMPLVGRVSMDMLAVDVTDMPEVKVGDPVELWGTHVSVDQVAELSRTISYDLLTGITPRVPRRYLG